MSPTDDADAVLALRRDIRAAVAAHPSLTSHESIDRTEDGLVVEMEARAGGDKNRGRYERPPGAYAEIPRATSPTSHTQTRSAKD